MMKMTLALRAAPLLALLAGCGEGPAGPARCTPPGTMSARINGRIWSSSTVVATGAGSTTIMIQGVAVRGMLAEQISITLRGVTTARTYRLGDAGAPEGNMAGIYTAAPEGSGSTLGDDAGRVTITSLSADNVAGTFSFRAGTEGNPAAYEVTDGIFNGRLR